MENSLSMLKTFIHNSIRWKTFKGNYVIELRILIYLNMPREVEIGKVSLVLIN
jgi:hypothetical protein